MDCTDPSSVHAVSLNGVRPRRPEQCAYLPQGQAVGDVSMESGLEDRNNETAPVSRPSGQVSQWSPA